MANHESHAYDFRKGGEQVVPKPKKGKKAGQEARPTKASNDAGTLTASKRKALAKSTFGLPSERKYPMPDKKHARLAKSGDSRALGVGNITAAQKRKIDAKANRILGD